MDCSPPGSSVHGIFQARILEWGCHFLLQWIFLTPGSNPYLPQTLYSLSHQGSFATSATSMEEANWAFPGHLLP